MVFTLLAATFPLSSDTYIHYHFHHTTIIISTAQYISDDHVYDKI